MEEIFSIYNQFLGYFPKNTHGIVSFGLAILLGFGIFKVVKKEFIYIILLVILLPASWPILTNIWDNLLNIIKFLLTKR